MQVFSVERKSTTDKNVKNDAKTLENHDDNVIVIITTNIHLHENHNFHRNYHHHLFHCFQAHYHHYSFIHSAYFYSASSSPLQLGGAPDTARIVPKRHRQLQVKDLPKVPTWRIELDLNPRP